MAGWSFVVTTQTPTEYSRHIDRDAILARWTTGAMGIRWIDRLVDKGRAEEVERGGYPNVYTSLARDVVPLFKADRTPSDGDSTYDPLEVTIRWDELKGLSPEVSLTIVVWDQS